MSDIYLHKLDEFAEKVLVPEYTQGRLWAHNPQYRKVQYAITRARRRGDLAEVRSLYRQLHTLPSQDPNDPSYRRLRYCRYADDTLLGFVGPKAETEQIEQRLTDFLRDDLALELSSEKRRSPMPAPNGRGSSATRFPSHPAVTGHADPPRPIGGSAARRCRRWRLASRPRPRHRTGHARDEAGGNLVAHVRMDGAWIASIDISINKAFAARALDISTEDLATNAGPGEQFYGIYTSNGGRIMIFASGVPLRRNGQVIGAVGVSGGTGEQDKAVAEAAATAM